MRRGATNLYACGAELKGVIVKCARVARTRHGRDRPCAWRVSRGLLRGYTSGNPVKLAFASLALFAAIGGWSCCALHYHLTEQDRATPAMTMLREESASLNGHGTTRSYGAIDPETQADRDRDSELEEPDLAPRSEAVLHGLRDGVRANEGALREIGPDAAYLPILLYAAYLTGRPTEPVRIRSRERLSMDQRAAAIDGILKGKVSAYLDDGMRLVRQAEMEDEQHGERSDHEHVRDFRGDATSPETAAEVEVEEMIWRRWRFNDNQLSGELTAIQSEIHRS